MKRLGTSTSVSETRSLHSYAEARENTSIICSSQPLKNSGKLSGKVISKQDSNIPTLLDSDTPVTSSSGKADLLNQYFLDCFNHTFPPLNNPAPLDPSSCPVSLLCTEEDVSELLHNLNPAKSTGLDGVSAIMLKSTAPSITASLTKLFNMSIATGCFPREWKCARITPIFKSSDPSLPKNYRPISILPIVSKLLERHVHSLACV